MTVKKAGGSDYAPPVKETKYSATSVHSKDAIAPDNAWIVSDCSPSDLIGPEVAYC